MSFGRLKSENRSLSDAVPGTAASSQPDAPSVMVRWADMFIDVGDLGAVEGWMGKRQV